MNPMIEERFVHLAMKVIGRQATDGERAELETLLASEPALRDEFTRLQADAVTAKEVLPLLEATRATARDFPGYARERLQTKVRQMLGPQPAQREKALGMRRWRWALGFAAATALLVLLMSPILRTEKPVIHVAMLDPGATRGSETNEKTLLQERWGGNRIETFSDRTKLEAWERDWTSHRTGPVVKVTYDPAAGEVRVSGRAKGKMFERTFLLEKDLGSALEEVNAFIQEQMQQTK
jgi:hypothetical protein